MQRSKAITPMCCWRRLPVKGDVVLADSGKFVFLGRVRLNDAELEQRQKTSPTLQIVCGWCGGMCDTAKTASLGARRLWRQPGKILLLFG